MSAKPKPAPRANNPLIARPMREAEGPRDPSSFKNFYQSIAVRFPKLKKMLAQAQMNYTPAGYVQDALVKSVIITVVLLFLTFVLLMGNLSQVAITAVLTPFFYIGSFLYMMGLPQVKASMRAKKIDQELVFAGRHMLIELKSGVPLFDAMLGISRDYGPVSEEFNRVIEKVALGVPFGTALQSVADDNSSQYFNRLILQMVNSLSSGADLATTLDVSLDQISKEQAIELKAYGQKLNPIVMFFMIFGIIMPSLGVAFLIIMVSFIGGASIAFGPTALFGIMLGVALIQFIFLSIVENSRPKFDIV